MNVDAAMHDLRARLAVIVGYAGLLERRGDEAFRLDAAARIQDAAADLEEMLEDLVPQVRTPAAGAAMRRRIVVADDDPVVRELLVATLDEEEFDVVEAGDGDEVAALLEPLPALVILDWRIPGGGGAAILERLKGCAPAPPVIVLTGDAGAETRATAGRGGADLYLTKPFSPLELLDAVERLATATADGRRPPAPGAP